MWIKPAKRKDRNGNYTYTYYRLIESIRTPAGVKQRTVLSLGTLTISKEKHKDLANRIEELLLGQKQVFAPLDKEIEPLAVHYANLIIEKELTLKHSVKSKEEEAPKPVYESVDISSVKNSHSRTVGGEHVSLSAFKKLKLDSFLQEIGFTKEQVNLTAASLTGRLLNPGSERSTREWLRNISGTGELLGVNFQNLSNNALYRISDLLYKNKSKIEKHLHETETRLFSLNNQIVLYDLTNTYLEGRGEGIEKAAFGRSKEKRSDCRLITLGLIIDEHGFPKASHIMEGNVSEPGTLLSMIQRMEKLESSRLSDGRKTVLIDAGISTRENLNLLKEKGYDYVCVAKGKPVELSEIDDKGMVLIKEDKKNRIEAQLIKKEEETILYCKSRLKRDKEQSMKTRYQERFEADLKNIESSLLKPRGVKQYDKVLKRIGRLTEKYSRIARFYSIDVIESKETGIVSSINWQLNKEALMEEGFSGSYFLKTSRMDLSEEDIWNLYITLNHVEDAFLTIKSDLDARPIYHKKGTRVDGHLFIVLLAYHLLNTIRYQLKHEGIDLRWSTIRKRLISHTVVTTSLTREGGECIHLRNCVEAEPFHSRIYDALGISHVPLKSVKTVL